MWRLGTDGLAERWPGKGFYLPGDERFASRNTAHGHARSPDASDGSINRINQGIQDTCLLYSVSSRNAACEHLAESFGIG